MEPNMLPAAIPRARIMQFGYSSSWFGKDAIKRSVDDIALQLIQDLRIEREVSILL